MLGLTPAQELVTPTHALAPLRVPSRTFASKKVAAPTSNKRISPILSLLLGIQKATVDNVVKKYKDCRPPRKSRLDGVVVSARALRRAGSNVVDLELTPRENFEYPTNSTVPDATATFEKAKVTIRDSRSKVKWTVDLNKKETLVYVNRLTGNLVVPLPSNVINTDTITIELQIVNKAGKKANMTLDGVSITDAAYITVSDITCNVTQMVNRPLEVFVHIQERKLQNGAYCDVTLIDDQDVQVGVTEGIWVDAGDMVTSHFVYTPSRIGPITLTACISNVRPVNYDSDITSATQVVNVISPSIPVTSTQRTMVTNQSVTYTDTTGQCTASGNTSLTGTLDISTIDLDKVTVTLTAKDANQVPTGSYVFGKLPVDYRISKAEGQFLIKSFFGTIALSNGQTMTINESIAIFSNVSGVISVNCNFDISPVIYTSGVYSIDNPPTMDVALQVAGTLQDSPVAALVSDYAIMTIKESFPDIAGLEHVTEEKGARTTPISYSMGYDPDDNPVSVYRRSCLYFLNNGIENIPFPI